MTLRLPRAGMLKRYKPEVLLERVIKKLQFDVDLGHLMKSKYVQTRVTVQYAHLIPEEVGGGPVQVS